MRKLLLAGIIILLMLLGFLFAGTTGKISGIITDAQTGEPLIGVNVVVEGTNLGAATNEDGFYYIINIPPGFYTVTASYIGYQTERKTNVKVVTDMTTKVFFKLKSATIQGEEIVVVAERPPIQKDLTSSVQSFASEEISRAPVENLTQLLETQAGVSIVEPTERASVIRDVPGDGLHIRGGRENETAYLVDGIRVDNPMWGGSNYAQTTSGSAVREMSTILGTFNAEYGGKMSGVINLVTREGSERLHGQFSGYTDKFGISAYDRNTWQGDVVLSGVIPYLKNLYFFANAQYRITDGRFKGYIIPGWTDLKGQVPIEDENGKPLGKAVSADWSDGSNALFKITWKAKPTLKFMGSFVYSYNRKKKYYHSYRYLPYNMPWSETTNYGLTLKMTHQLGRSTFYELAASYQRVNYWMGVHKVREKRILLGSRQTESRYGFYYSGAYQNYWADTTKTYQLVGNITSQVTSLHQIKTGFELRYLDLFHRLENAWTTPVDEVVIGTDEEGNLIKKAYNNHKAFSKSKPLEAAAYIQDKMEFERLGMILNIGLRWERWSLDKKYMENPEDPMNTRLRPTKPKDRISPRLGISYPISDRAAFHFAYGHFYQFPSYVKLLSGINEEGRYPDRPNLQDIGLAIFNPNINPEKSVTYEAGVQTQLMKDLTLNVTAFFRKLSDLVGIRWIQTAGYVYFDNVDFGESKGLEFTLKKRYSHHFSGRINYTLSQTLISTSSPLTAAQTLGAPIAYRSYLADWDRTHDLTALLMISEPNNWSINVIAKFKSGRPYTVLAEQPNTERMPWNINVDLKLSKYLNLLGLKETVYLQIFNLFNRRNIYSVYAVTGKWDDDGDPGTPYAYDANPRRISDKRRVRIGMNITF